MDISYFQKINNTYKAKSNKEVQLYHLKNHINNRFTDTIDYYSVLVNDKIQDLLIIRTNDHFQKIIKARPNEDFDVGDCINFDNNIWLVISKDMCNQVYTTGIMQLTNFIIKFQHPTTGAILSYPCITSNKTQGTGENEGKYITLPDGRKSVLLPFDESTILLRNGNRFFLDKHPTEPTPYKITHVDTTTYNYGDKGLIELIVVEDQLQDDDRPDLGVCDYFEPTTPSNPVEGGYVKINISSLMIGITTVINPTFYSNEGAVQNDVIALWDINKPDGVTVSYVDNKCKITIPDDYNLLGESVVIKVSDGDGNYSSTFELVIRGW